MGFMVIEFIARTDLANNIWRIKVANIGKNEALPGLTGVEYG